jgi:poly(beta-D-mannuronate) lyase
MPKAEVKTLALAVCIAALGCQHPAPAPLPATALAPGVLHSPWDLTPIAATDIPYTCGPAAPIGPDITVAGSLDDSKNQHLSEDVKAAVYLQSSRAIEDLTTRVVRAADNYRSTGSRQAAECAANLLATAAASHAMTGYIASNEAWAERSTALHAFTIAWLKIRGDNPISPMDTQMVLYWMEDLMRQERDHYEHFQCTASHCYIKNHKGLSVAVDSAAIGIAENNYSLFHWAVSEYHSAVSEINGRGMLHYDTKGRYAFKNNLRSAARLVQIAEFAEINGEPLYGYDNGAIHLLVHTVALGIVNAEPYHTVTKSSQAVPNGIQPWEISWASVYNRRFPDPLITSLLQQVGPGGADMWGGEPWDPNGDPDS